MLQPLRDPKKRERELQLLAEWEAAGKIRRVDERRVDEKEVLFAFSDDRLEDLGNGNFRIMKSADVPEKVIREEAIETNDT